MYIYLYMYICIYRGRKLVSVHQFTFLRISRYIDHVLFVVPFVHILKCIFMFISFTK